MSLDANSNSGITKKTSKFALGFKPLKVKIICPFIIIFSMIFTSGIAFYIDILASQNVSVIQRTQNSFTPPTDPRAEGAINILLQAIDSRDGENAQLASGSSGALADTNMIVHVSANRKFVQVVSLPRDTLVQMPECASPNGKLSPSSQIMLNAVFSTGYYGAGDIDKNEKIKYGASCAITTIEKVTGIKIDHYAVVDFKGFINTVNVLGGIDICIPQSFGPLSHSNGLTLTQGFQHLDAETTMQYARARHGIGDSSDYGRMRRQQAVIGAIVNKVYKSLDFYNISKLYGFAKESIKAVTTDIDINLAGALLYSLRDIDMANFTSFTAPITNAPQNPNRLIFKEPEATTVWNYFITDKSVFSLNSNSDSKNVVKSPTPSEIAILDGTMTVKKIIPPELKKKTSVVDPKDETGIIQRPSTAQNSNNCEGQDW